MRHWDNEKVYFALGERTNERSEGHPLANGAFGDDKLKGER